MKKLIFFTILSIMFTSAVSAFSVPVITPEKKIASNQNEYVTLKAVAAADFNFWWCTATVVSVTPIGQDMYGNNYYDVVIQVNCIWIDMSLATP